MDDDGARRYAAEGLLIGGKVVRGRDLLVRAGRVVGQVARSAATPGYRVERAPGLVASGLVDIHTHGAFGVALDAVDPAREPEALDGLRRALGRRGVAAFVASLPSLTAAGTERQLDRLAPFAGRVQAGLATLLGVHLEGPFLAAARRGAHAARNLRAPDAEALAGWLDRHPGLVRMVTLAPEEPGAGSLAAAVQARGAVAAIGHSDASAGETERAFALGMRHATHLWNAMPPLGHRAPGVVGAVLESAAVTAELICDGHHLDPRVAALTVHHLGPHRVALVTDAMAAAGLGDGTYRLGDLEATVRDGVVRAPDGVLAGSTLMLDTAVRNVVAWKVASVPWAHAMASAVPARVIGAEGFGTLAEGAVAKLVCVREDGLVTPLGAEAEEPAGDVGSKGRAT